MRFLVGPLAPRDACHFLPLYHHVVFRWPIHRPSNNILDRRKGSRLNNTMSRRLRSGFASGPAKKTPVETAVSIMHALPAQHCQDKLKRGLSPASATIRSKAEPSRSSRLRCFSFQWGKITPDFHANPHSATRGRNGATLTLDDRSPQHPGNATHSSHLSNHDQTRDGKVARSTQEYVHGKAKRLRGEARDWSVICPFLKLRQAFTS